MGDEELLYAMFVFFFQAEDGIRDDLVTGVQTCALPISHRGKPSLRAPSIRSRWIDGALKEGLPRCGELGILRLVGESEIGRASCRERVWSWVVGGAVNEKEQDG